MRLLQVLLRCEGLAAPLVSSPANFWRDWGTPYARCRNLPQEDQGGHKVSSDPFPMILV
jgi:hypothetical protein